jgi:hypothetical protein
MGALFARLGIGRIPEENERPAALIPLCLPALETRSPMARKKTNKDHV